MIKNKWNLFSFLVIFGLFVGCGHDHDHAAHEAGEHADHAEHKDESHHDAHGHHAHVAPHGGTLVVFGEEFAHIEIVLDEKSGEMTGYILDGEAEKSIRVQQKEIKMRIELQSGEKFELTLIASSNKLTGETVGDTSEFKAQSDKLKGVQKFIAIIKDISIRGKAFGNVNFHFPEGNETGAGLTACCDYSIRPVLIDLKINPSQIEVRVQSNVDYWVGEILGVSMDEKLPGKDWPEKYQEAAKKHIEESFELQLDGQPIRFSSFNSRFVQDIFRMNLSKVVYDFVYDVDTANGKLLSGRSQFFATYKKKLDQAGGKSSLPKEFSTHLTVYGEKTTHYDLPFDNPTFQISLENNVRSPGQVKLDKFKVKAVELVKSPPVLLLIVIVIIYLVRRKFYGRH